MCLNSHGESCLRTHNSNDVGLRSTSNSLALGMLTQVQDVRMFQESSFSHNVE